MKNDLQSKEFLMNSMAGRRRAKLFILGIVVVLVIVFGVEAGRLLVVESAQPADLILVLAGETDFRPAHALELLRRKMAPRVMIDVPDVKIYDAFQMELARKYASSLPEAPAVSVCPIYGLSTREESHDVEKCLASENVRSILIVTSDFHTRRALSIYRHELRGRTFGISGSHDSLQFGTRWWTHRQWAKTCAEEWLRTLWWNAVERWR